MSINKILFKKIEKIEKREIFKNKLIITFIIIILINVFFQILQIINNNENSKNSFVRFIDPNTQREVNLKVEKYNVPAKLIYLNSNTFAYNCAFDLFNLNHKTYINQLNRTINRCFNLTAGKKIINSLLDSKWLYLLDPIKYKVDTFLLGDIESNITYNNSYDLEILKKIKENNLIRFSNNNIKHVFQVELVFNRVFTKDYNSKLEPTNLDRVIKFNISFLVNYNFNSKFSAFDGFMGNYKIINYKISNIIKKNEMKSPNKNQQK